MLGLALFNNFINDPDDWAEHTFSTFADKLKLGEVADTRWLCHHSEGSGPAGQLLPKGSNEVPQTEVQSPAPGRE